jgi:hypothetical protein
VLPLEALEGRKLLSGSFDHELFPFSAPFGHSGNTIQFDQAPSSVQGGLDTLATNGGFTAPDPTTSTQTVFLRNSNGVETYTMYFGTTFPRTRYTVDVSGAQVVAPVITSETFETLTTNDALSAAEITAIAAAKNLTPPTNTTNVQVITPTVGNPTFIVSLDSATSDGWFRHDADISVDSAGNPIGNQNLPFNVIPSTIQGGLNGLVPAGGTTYDPTTSTQPVYVRTQNGFTTYSVVFTVAGTPTKVTVDDTGAVALLPGFSQTTYSLLSGPAFNELQTLATADGVTTPIASSQAVTQYTENNGTPTVLYTVRLPGTPVTTPWGGTYTPYITITVDQVGNPTTIPFGQDDWGFGSLRNFGGGEGFGQFSGFDDAD